ncbi:MAG: hypothetical protein K8R69_11610 [Deltaproteobacteria bacterium]|nr:hypothetical protein [Deltaproteobacteria bacterium]
MSPLPESQLVRRVLDLRESCSDAEAFAHEMSANLSLSSEEARAIAGVLEDRFVSPEEQLQLLGTLELRGALSEGSSTNGFLRILAGTDGREALRHRARYLVDGLRSEPHGTETADAAIEELTRLLPHGFGVTGDVASMGSPLAVGMLHYLRPEDSFLRGLVEELCGYREASGDPVLRMRSARVLAGLGDRDASSFLRESTAAFAVDYRGSLGTDEILARASGLAADGDPAASHFLQNLAMNPAESVTRRYLALSRLRPDSLEPDSGVIEVFRSLAEDPEEPVPTRYRMLLLLANTPHPPDAGWWRSLLADPSMTLLSGRETSGGGASPGGFSGAEFSQWNLVLTALGGTAEPWAGEILLEAAGNRGFPLAQRREALMDYFLSQGSGSLPWETVSEVLGASERPLGEMRLRFPHGAASVDGERAIFDLRRLGFIEKEYVLNLRETGMGTRILDFRPIAPASDRLSPSVAMRDSETALPLNRRVVLWPSLEASSPRIEIAEMDPEETPLEEAGSEREEGPETAPAPRSNGQQMATAPRSNHRQNRPGERATEEDHNEERGI